MTKKTRRLDFSSGKLEGITFSTEKPPADSVFQKLWDASQELAQAALHSDFIQGIGTGTLDPHSFGGYSIQDVAYCLSASRDYQRVEKDAEEPTLAAFAEARYESNQSYIQTLFKQWHLDSGTSVEPGEAFSAYIHLEETVASNLHPIYGVVVMIPCDYLWYWLAYELKSISPPNNVYQFWIDENDDPGGGYRLGNFIDSFFKNHPAEYDYQTALNVFRSAMLCEVNCFRAACGQSLIHKEFKPKP